MGVLVILAVIIAIVALAIKSIKRQEAAAQEAAWAEEIEQKKEAKRLREQQRLEEERLQQQQRLEDAGLSESCLQFAQRMKEQSLGLSPEDMVEFLLTGESDPTADISAPYLQQTLQGSFFFVKVKDESHLALDADAYRNDVSLKGEFIRQVLASELTDADKAAVIRAGLQALSGEEISL